MKKILSLLIITFCAINLFAQEENVSFIKDIIGPSYNILVGPKVGLNFSRMSGDPEGIKMNFKNGTGINAGAAANIHFGRRSESSKGGTGLFGAQIEALYSQHSVKTGAGNLDIDYFEVPILFQYYISPKFNLEVGPTFAGTIGRSPDELTIDNASIATKEIKGMDVLMTVGAGYRFNCGFTLNARYNIGMSKLTDNFPAKTNIFQVSLGWMFKIIE